ncbi:hypothetical protein [Paenibacillus thalictri]|uniref:Transposase n=1 Tax=Paenibacillus thalictri TaxID=2527873 RepID=A0A4V2J3U5_9BACL|nr:hypothetical protein [Paenibacillus thalictri]TBL75634.1 hypothetical protein EYB31_21800 [Paenibacillus thalictri]
MKLTETHRDSAAIQHYAVAFAHRLRNRIVGMQRRVRPFQAWSAEMAEASLCSANVVMRIKRQTEELAACCAPSRNQSR